MQATAAATFGERYLAILGVARQAPSLAYLAALTDRHLDEIPYENVSKLLRRASGHHDLPTPDEYIAGVEAFRFGGTCYTINYFFALLLRELGFQVSLIGGRSQDGTRDHLSLSVCVDALNYCVDLGFMSPNPGPFSLSGPAREMYFGTQLYRFEPHGDGLQFKFQVSRHGQFGREFCSEPTPRRIEDFSEVIAQSFAADRLFMKMLCISRRFGDTFKLVWGQEFGVVRGKEAERRKIANGQDLERILRDEMQLGAYPISAALEVLLQNGAPYGV